MSAPLDSAGVITVRRSELACPAHSLKMMAKAAASEADENGRLLQTITTSIDGTRKNADDMQQVMRAIDTLTGDLNVAVDGIAGTVERLAIITRSNEEQAQTLRLRSNDLKSSASGLETMMSQFRLAQ